MTVLSPSAWISVAWAIVVFTSTLAIEWLIPSGMSGILGDADSALKVFHRWMFDYAPNSLRYVGRSYRLLIVVLALAVLIHALRYIVRVAVSRARPRTGRTPEHLK